jgi:hypothetical protein
VPVDTIINIKEAADRFQPDLETCRQPCTVRTPQKLAQIGAYKTSGPSDNVTISYTFNEPRTLSQVFLNFALLRVAVVIAFYHLVALQQKHSKESTKALLLYIFLPTFPIASYLCRVVHAGISLFKEHHTVSNWTEYSWYRFATVLGLNTFSAPS